MNLSTANFSICLITIPPIVIGLFYFLILKPMEVKIRSLEKSKNYRDSTDLRKQGCTSTYGGGELGKDFINYDLRSWDAGKNWYAVKYDFDTKEFKILGEAEVVYPKLLNHLKAWDELTSYAKHIGGIKSISDTIGMKCLENVGFTIEKK